MSSKVFCQPLLNARSQQCIGVEILLRWNNPRQGLDFTGCVYSYRGRTSFNCATDPLCDGRNHSSAPCFPNE